MKRFLEQINSPLDLQALPAEDLPALAEEIRETLLDTVYETGGHLGSNLGAVELTLALHRVFDFSRDRLIFDVSHQCYTHKLITGRRKQFHSLRQKGGLSGFTNRFESPYDCFTVGHAGTAISTGLGIAAGDAELGVDRQVVAFVGDACMGCGSSFEALNHGGVLDRNLLVVLNDNRWSISKTVGALSAYLNRIRTSPLYTGAKKEIRSLMSYLPLVGRKIDEGLKGLARVIRSSVVPGRFFEELGLGYYGPIDGHDIKTLTETMERLKKFKGIVILHVLTEKGRGAHDAEEKEDRLHGVSPRKVEPDAEAKVVLVPGTPSRTTGKSWTRAFADTLIEQAEDDERVCAVTAAMPHGTGLNLFAARFPTRFHDTGIAEQHAVGFSSGLAAAGLRPVVAIYSTFLQRAYDNVFQEMMLQKLPLLLAIDRAGIVGEDGATHNGLFDISYLRTLPGMVLVAPRDETELRLLMRWALANQYPLAMRYPRGKCPVNERGLERPPLELGKAELLRSGEKVAIFGYGTMAYTALEAADLLAAKGLDPAVWNARFAKPLDQDLLTRVAREFDLVVTLEEHALHGGFGSAVLEAVSAVAGGRTRVVRCGVPDRFLEHGSRAQILHELGLDPVGVAATVTRELSTGSRRYTQKK